MQPALVIGYGSAGARHAEALEALGLEVAIVSRRSLAVPRAYDDLAKALIETTPDYVVVADETARHAETLAALARHDYRGRVLVEKPLGRDAAALPDHGFAGLFLGYQLRFHPLLDRLRGLLDGQRVITAQAYVGQHLAKWRPDRPYSESYSSRRAAGGGALRDLSHEIDLLLWLFGDWRGLAALGGQHGVLEIDSDDAFALLIETAGCPVMTLQVNYLDRIGRREIIVNAERTSFHLDLLSGTLRYDDKDERHPATRQEMDQAMHRAVLEGDDSKLCTADEGLAVMRVIEAAERAAQERIWVAA